MVEYKDFYKGFKLVYIKNSKGLEVTLSSFGASFRSIKLHGKELSLTPLDPVEFIKGYQGKTIGRTSGRIKDATYTLNGRVAKLGINSSGVDNNHGAMAGFNSKLWDTEVNEGKEYIDVSFRYFSPDMDGGYPEDVFVKITYRIYNEKNTIDILMDGETESVALLNMTNHVFLNLNGDLCEPIFNHELYINANKHGRVNERTLVVERLHDYRFDFTKPMEVGKYINDEEVEANTRGYDHPFYLNERGLKNVAASLYSPLSGIKLEVRTTYPCVVIYTNNWADPNMLVLPNVYDSKHLAICIECQYEPNSINTSPECAGVFSKDNPFHEEISFTFTDN